MTTLNLITALRPVWEKSASGIELQSYNSADCRYVCMRVASLVGTTPCLRNVKPLVLIYSLIINAPIKNMSRLVQDAINLRNMCMHVSYFARGTLELKQNWNTNEAY